MNDDILGFQVDLTDDEVRTLLYAVTEALRTWPGGSAELQERLVMLKHSFFVMTLEMALDQRSEGDSPR